MARNFILERPSFIDSQLIPAGARITDAHLHGAEPGSALIETDERDAPLDPADTARLLNLGVNLAPIQVAPIQPHAPNPTQPQAIPAQPAGGVSIAGDQNYVPADGVESKEAAKARVEDLERQLETARAAAEAADGVEPSPSPAATPVAVPPLRRATTAAEVPAAPVAEPGALDQSVPDLEAHLQTVDDPAELQRLRDAETAGKSRKGALDAIDARFAEVSS